MSATLLTPVKPSTLPGMPPFGVGMPFDLKINVAPKVQPDFPPAEKARMYAIAFDMDTDTLKKAYPNPSWQNAYSDIKRILTGHGFTWQQGSVYFGNDQVNAVTCVLAAMDLSRSLSWFAISVRDIRMLRIEEQNDLGLAVQQAAPVSKS